MCRNCAAMSFLSLSLCVCVCSCFPLILQCPPRGQLILGRIRDDQRRLLEERERERREQEEIQGQMWADVRGVS